MRRQAASTTALPGKARIGAQGASEPECAANMKPCTHAVPIWAELHPQKRQLFTYQLAMTLWLL